LIGPAAAKPFGFRTSNLPPSKRVGREIALVRIRWMLMSKRRFRSGVSVLSNALWFRRRRVRKTCACGLGTGVRWRGRIRSAVKEGWGARLWQDNPWILVGLSCLFHNNPRRGSQPIRLRRTGAPQSAMDHQFFIPCHPLRPPKKRLYR